MLYDISSSCKNIPIYIIGAGGIVNTAHLPAYKIAGFNVQGIYDIDHNKVVTTASNFNLPNVFSSLQEMLLQTDGKKIILFPAWPKETDVHFKLHAPYNTTVEAKLKNGKLIMLKVLPENRKADIVLMSGTAE